MTDVSFEQPVVFHCAGDQLVGMQHLPAPADPAREIPVAVIMVVGGPQYRVGSHRQFVHTARHLAREGFPVFRFDYRGMGDSKGEPRSFEHVHEDIDAAIDSASERLPAHRIVLFGLCDAASAILMYRRSRARTAGLILLNPWVRTDATLARSMAKHYYARRMLQRSFWHKVLSFDWDVKASMRDLSATAKHVVLARGVAARSFVDAMRLGLEVADEPALFVLSGQDLTAREFDTLIANDASWRRLMRRSQTSVMRFEESDHTFSNSRSLDESNDSIVQWLRLNVSNQPMLEAARFPAVGSPR